MVKIIVFVFRTLMCANVCPLKSWINVCVCESERAREGGRVEEEGGMVDNVKGAHVTSF